MIDLRDIKANNDSIQKIIKWKANIGLCDLIMAIPINLNEEDAKFWLMKNSKDQNQIIKGIYVENEFVGIARLMFIDNKSKNAEVGLYLGEEKIKSKGVGSYVLKELIKISNRKLNLNKIYARIRCTNNYSLRLFYRQGFIKEGVLKRHYQSLIDNKFDDVYYVSLFY